MVKKLFKNVLLISALCTLFTGSIFAKEPDTAPVDEERQEFTTIEESILIPESEIEVEPDIAGRYVNGMVLGDGVRLRSEPSTSAPVLELMYYGEPLIVSQAYVAPGWMKVQRVKTGRWGYVSDKYVWEEYID
ncbi:SH3 domain-containing protein [Candidatus Merdisoma sp. JLR.KK011]|uniref:SH3 domain-containing protein n=1 Tax=Candidatus Merdisoma sp. JLR.KK011 TaxID=3114299 RepID=UPI002FEF9AE7